MGDIEQFKSDFEDALTQESKKDVIDKFLDNIDYDNLDQETEEIIKEFRNQLEDYRLERAIETDARINQKIENGSYKLYKCTGGDIPVGTYYVDYTDLASEYRLTGIHETSEEVAKMIDKIKPVCFVIVDDGIGTLKRSQLISVEQFNKYFELYG